MRKVVTSPRTARERVRAELVGEIKDVARRHLGEHGSSALSLRAVARDLGMVSSAVYRYFPSRDELITALIVDAYVDFGAAVVEAERAIRRSDFAGRWLASCRAARRWALAKPQEYALIFGSPIPGYAAPVDTIDPAAIVPLVLVSILSDAASVQSADSSAAAIAADAWSRTPMPKVVRADIQPLSLQIAPQLSAHQVARGVMAWTQLVGSISFELFGHLHNVIAADESYFDFQMRVIATDLGLAR